MIPDDDGKWGFGILQLLQIILVMRQARSSESEQNRRENRRGIELGGRGGRRRIDGDTAEDTNTG